MFKIQSSNSNALKTKILKSKIQNSKSEVQNQNLRILLWDIDGTLLRSTQKGAFHKYFAPAMERIYGSSGTLDKMSVAGMTDSQIACEALKDEGFTPKQIFSKIDDFIKILGEKMSDFVNDQEKPYIILPGANEILEATSKNPQFVNALLTGNFTVGAEIKLKYFDLWKYFEHQPNTFGETSHDRSALSKIAVKNVEKFLKTKISPRQFIVIGDTPNDIACARAIGAKMISVATGRNHPPSELAEFEPDIILENLGDTAKVLRILETI